MATHRVFSGARFGRGFSFLTLVFLAATAWCAAAEVGAVATITAGNLVVAVPADTPELSLEERAQVGQIRAEIDRFVREQQVVTDALLAEFSGAVFDPGSTSFVELVARRFVEATGKRGDALAEYQRFHLVALVLRSREQPGKAEAIGRVLAERINQAQRAAVKDPDSAEKLLLLEVEIRDNLLHDAAGAAAVLDARDPALVGNSSEIEARRERLRERQRREDEIAAASTALRERLEIEQEAEAATASSVRK